MEMTAEYEAMCAVMRTVDPATWPGLSTKERLALSRFAKFHADVNDFVSGEMTVQQKAECFDILARGVDSVKLSVDGSNDHCYPECTEDGLLRVAQNIYDIENYDPDAEDYYDAEGV